MAKVYRGPYKGLAIRLALHGCTNRPFYHLVVMPIHRARNDPPIEQIGSFEDMTNNHNEKLVAVNFDRVMHWLARGAQPTIKVRKLLGLSGFLPIHPMTFITAKRNMKKLAEPTDPTGPTDSTDPTEPSDASDESIEAQSSL